MSDESQKDIQAADKDVTRRTLLVAAGATGIAAMAGEASADQPQSKGKFEPNRLTFAQGIERIKKATGNLDSYGRGKIVTSRDPGAEKVMEALKVDNLPGGFTKYQLPVFFDGGPGSQFFMTSGSPNAKVGKHSHDEGDGLRFIVSGSIMYEGKELTAGDWMFVPKGVPYSFEVGRMGAGMFYCYQCCCA